MLKSLYHFVFGIVKYGWAFFVLVFLDITDIYDNYIKPELPEAWGVSAMSQMIFWPVVAIGIFWAAFMSYHELRKKIANFSPEGAESLSKAYQHGRLLVDAKYEDQEEWATNTYNLINKLAPEMFCVIKNARPCGAEISDHIVIESKLDALTKIITEYHRRQIGN